MANKDDLTDSEKLKEPIIIDGSYLEGGGQIVRTALGFATLLGRSVEIIDIRKGRKVSGLKAQHLTAIKALKDLCGAKVVGGELGSEKVVYTPGLIKPKTIAVDIGTAGSISLMLQALWVPMILAGGKCKIKIKGGTDVKWAMPFDYLTEVFIPQLQRYADIKYRIIRRGFFPKGGGDVEIKIRGNHSLADLNSAPPINLIEQGRLVQIRGVSYASHDLQEAQVSERQAQAAKQQLLKYHVPVLIRAQYSITSCSGSGVTLWAVYSQREDEIDIENPIRLGGDALGERGWRAEFVGEGAAKKLMKEMKSGAPVDSHLADNLVPFIGLFGGSIRVAEITDHTRTNVYVVNKFLGNVLEIDEEKSIVRKK